MPVTDEEFTDARVRLRAASIKLNELLDAMTAATIEGKVDLDDLRAEIAKADIELDEAILHHRRLLNLRKKMIKSRMKKLQKMIKEKQLLKKKIKKNPKKLRSQKKKISQKTIRINKERNKNTFIPVKSRAPLTGAFFLYRMIKFRVGVQSFPDINFIMYLIDRF